MSYHQVPISRGNWTLVLLVSTGVTGVIDKVNRYESETKKKEKDHVHKHLHDYLPESLHWDEAGRRFGFKGLWKLGP